MSTSYQHAYLTAVAAKVGGLDAAAQAILDGMFSTPPEGLAWHRDGAVQVEDYNDWRGVSTYREVTVWSRRYVATSLHGQSTLTLPRATRRLAA